MKEIRIEVTEMNECPLYSFFTKDADSTRDEYEYLGCVGISFNLTGKKSPTSIGGAMNCPIVF